MSSSYKDVFKLKKKTALPVIQKEKIKNSEKDVLMGGGIPIHELKFHKNANRTTIDKFH